MNTIVWMHGYPLSPAVFDDQLSIAGFEHVVPALPGFGGTPVLPGEPMTIADYARFVLDGLDARGIEKATFAGLSMGGYVALAALRIAPERFERLILIDTRETPDDAAARKARFATMGKVRMEGLGPVVDSMLPKMLTPDAPDAMKARVRGIMETASTAGVVSALRAMANRPDSSPLLPEVVVPVLVVCGESDTITPLSDAERMAAAIPGARLACVPGAAHLANVEQPALFNAAVREFLGG